jgi:hypothetical protein
MSKLQGKARRLTYGGGAGHIGIQGVNQTIRSPVLVSRQGCLLIHGPFGPCPEGGYRTQPRVSTLGTLKIYDSP